MDSSKSDSKLPISLPECVSEAVVAADDLYDFVSSLPFPDLEGEVSCADEGAPILSQALEWAKAIDQKHEAVVQLFPPRETGVEVPVRVPPVRRMMGKRGLDGGMVPVFEHEIEEPTQGAITHRPVSMFVASDVLEPVPPRFQNSLASAFPLAPKDWSQLPGVDVIRQHIRGIWEGKHGWNIFASHLHGAMIVVRSKSLGLVAWIRERAAELRRATWPEISWESSRSYGGQIVRVSMAGASRSVDLTGGQHDFLDRIASGPADCYRKDKSKLIAKIPELKPFMTSLGVADAESKSRYRLPPEIAGRIHVKLGD